MTPSLSLKRFGLTAFVMLLIVAPLIMQGAIAAPQAVSWGVTQVRSTVDSNTDTYSAIDTDSNGKIHMAWLEYNASNADASRLLYTNNVSGSWLPPFQVTPSAGRGGEPLLDMKVEGNRVHFLYIRTIDSYVAHQYVTLNGATPTMTGGGVSLTPGNKGANPRLVVDTANRVHAFYISRTSESAPYQVYHRSWNVTNWGLPIVISPDGQAQKFPNPVVTADNRIHLAFLSSPDATDTDIFRYYIYSGGAWQKSTDLFIGKAKQLHLSTDGATIFALYTAQASSDSPHNLYMRQGSNGSWSTPVTVSDPQSFATNPHGYYNPALKTLFIFWAGGPADGKSNRLVVREYVPSVGFSGQVDLGGSIVQYPRATGTGSTVTVIWQDKISGTYDIRMRSSGTGPPPPTTVPPTGVPATPVPTQAPTVDFTLNRVSSTPTRDPNVTLGIANPVGSPTQMRYSLAPFAAGDPTLPWQTLQNTFVVNTAAAAAASCRVDIFVQVRNSGGAFSPVRSVGVIVDTTIQAVGTLSSIETAPAAARPANAVADEQPFAPNGADPNYTRSTTFFYSFIQEQYPCAGVRNYQVETYAMSPAQLPSIVSGFAPFNPFNTATDTNGTGLIEQPLTANLIMTDTLGSKMEMTKTIFYDDDPPVLSAGGTIAFSGTTSTNQSLVTVQFTASVTDDGYTNSAAADKKYWGVWIVATKSQTLPDPEVFAQYGKVHQLEPGSTSVTSVNLTNDYDQETPTPAMRTSGPRYVHIRFLDGAGNYSTTGLTSPAITLVDPFIDGSNAYMPRVAK